MKENRIKTSTVLENQLPSFVQEEYPLFIEFLQRYYDSLDYQSGVKDILENIDDYVKIDNLTNLIESTLLEEDVNDFSTTIIVKSTKGFPLKSGIIQIDDEIIFYDQRDKANNTFTDCIRGFSGRTTDKNGKEDQLVFLDSLSASHVKGAEVRNLSILFLKIFLEKAKKQLVPGFDGRSFTPGLNQATFIKQAKDFYASKGSESSFKILFNALYGVDVQVIKPSDFVLEPSNADYRINKVIAAEVISGDIEELVNKTIYQDQYESINEAYGTVSNVVKVSEDGQEYYLLYLDNDYLKDITVNSGTIFGNFTVHSSSRSIGNVPGPLIDGSNIIYSSTIDVDSTVGFAENGTLYIDYDDGQDLEVTYTSKSLTQFFGCSGIKREIPSGKKIRINTVAYGYGDNQEIITFKVTGVLSDFNYPVETNMMFKDDTIQISSLGYSNASNFKANNWIFNLSTKHKVKEIKDSGNFNYEIVTYDPINTLNGDRVLINAIIRTRDGSLENVNRFFDVSVGSNPFNSFKITNDSTIVTIYSVQRLLRKVFDSDINSDVQNTYVDGEGSVYVTSPSLPFYYNQNLDLNPGIISFDANLNGGDTIGALNHGFVSGEAVVYLSGEGNNKLNIDRGIYFVKRIDNNTFKLARSRSNIFNDNYLSLSGIVTANSFVPLKYASENTDGVSQIVPQQIKAQNIIRKIEEPSNDVKNNKIIPGSVGIFVNGVEILTPISEDSIKYGSIENIDVVSKGSDYDVINPPKIVITDQTGIGASAYCHVVGSLSKIDILSAGFDYINEPTISVNGGNGSGALVKSNLSAFTNAPSFNAIAQAGYVDITVDTISFPDYHKFRDGEKVIYKTQGGVTIGGLVNGSIYYVSVLSARKIKLYNSFNDVLSKTNHLPLNSYGTGIHLFESFNKKKRLSSINIINPGSGYANRKNYFNSTNINLYSNTFIIKNNGYTSGEIIKYTPISNVVGGLTSGDEYYVTKIDSNTFRLSEVGENNLDKQFYYRNKVYIDLLSFGDGYFNYPEIKVSISGRVGISSVYSTEVSGIGTFNSASLNYISIASSANIEVGHILSPISGFIATDTRVTSVEINRIAISTSHLYTSGIASTSISFNEYIDFDAKIIPSFRGEISTIQLTNNGVGYGSSDIINYDRQPEIYFESGANAQAVAIVSDGIIKQVLIRNAGNGYNSQPNITVTGGGFGANLTAILDADGSIDRIEIINGGLGYDPQTTKILIENSGFGAKSNVNITTWSVNLFKRYDETNQISQDGGFIKSGIEGLQYCHLYPPSQLRENVYSSLVIDSENIIYRSDLRNDRESVQYHSPIIGWAYDGNPIYGPYGYKEPFNASTVSQMRSGYVLTRKANRPANFISGFFVEDYEYRGEGDLDIHNGRFCKTPEFPNGVYAYFATFTTNIIDAGNFRNQKEPVFPYIMGTSYRSRPISYNFSSSSIQKNFNQLSQQVLRNTFKYNLGSLNTDYGYLTNTIKTRNETSNVKKTTTGSISDIQIISGGTGYKVGESIIFDTENTDGGFGAAASIEKISGKNINRLYATTTKLNAVEVIASKDAQNEYLFVSSQPHEFIDNEYVTLSGINTTGIQLKQAYRIKVLTNTLQLRVGVDTTYVTGISTYIQISGNLNEPNILENDLFEIGNEVVKVVEVDKNNSRIKVLRSQNGNDGSYNVGTFLIEKSRKFAVVDNVQQFNYGLTREYYFDPNNSVGLGTTGTYTLFFNKTNYGSPVAIGTGTTTLLYFNDKNEILNYAGGYVSVRNATNSSFNVEKAKVVSVGSTSITINFNSSALGVGTTGVNALIDKWISLDIPVGTIYLPNHKFTTGQKVKYSTKVGTGLTISSDISSYILSNNSILYTTKLSEDLIGISTIKVGLGTQGSYVGIETTGSLLNIVGFGTGTVHSFSTTNQDEIVTTTIERNLVSVETEEDPQLLVGDKIDLISIPNYKENISVIYDDTNRRLLINPTYFNSNSVDVDNNIITINNHKFVTGEKILYTSTESSGDLIPNRSYYVNVIDSSRINLYTSLNDANNTLVIFTSQVSGKLSKINPQIIGTIGQTLVFDLKDTSLSYIRQSIVRSAFTFELFSDINFNNNFVSSKGTGNFEVASYGQIGVSTDARVEVKITEELPNTLWYRLNSVLDPFLETTKKEIIIDDENNTNHSRITKKYSSFNGRHSIVGVSTTSFSYSINEYPENDEYLVSSADIFKYTTSSTNPSGSIANIKVISGGKNYKVLPTIKKIATVNGKDSMLFPLTKTIGKVLKIRLDFSGVDYSSDITLKPQAKLPQIAKLDPLTSFTSITVSNPGFNYSFAPDLIVKDGFTNKIIDDTILEYKSGESVVKIIKNTNKLYNTTPTIIPVNNSNGIKVKDVVFDSVTKNVRVILDPDYSRIEDFPFAVGDRFLLENISSIEESGLLNRGYNSQSYNYDLFVVDEIDPNIGGANGSVTFSLASFLGNNQSPGLYDASNSIAKIIPEKYFPIFEVKLKTNNFYVGETVYSTTNTSTGIVEYWDKNNQYLKISSRYTFNKDEIIIGESSSSQASIKEITSFGGTYNVNSSSIIESGWGKNTGFLNNELQRIHDNDYYQYLSYALKSIIPFDKWDDPVSSLTHTAGYKKFSDLSVESEDKTSSGISTEQNFGDFGAITDLSSMGKFACTYDFDIAAEQSITVNNRNVSEQILLNSELIQDYAKSIGNKVLIIDDISPEFNSEPRIAKYGIVNTIRLSEIRFRKYIMCISDKRFTSEKEIVLLTFLHNGEYGYLNQYARVDTYGDLGYFDFEIFGEQGSLLFYPTKYEFNDYNTAFLSFDLSDTVTSGSLNIGSSVRIRNENLTIPVGIASTTVFSMPTSYRSAKILIQYRRDDSSYEVDEITLVHNGSRVEILEYGQLIDIPNASPYSSPGFGTYNAFIEGSTVKLNFVPSQNNSIAAKSFIVDLSATETGIGSTFVNTGQLQSNYTSIGSTSGPTETIVSSFTNDYSGAYYFVCVEDTTNSRYQVSELVICSDQTNSNITEFAIITTDNSLGTFTTDSDGSQTYLKFTPLENINVNVRVFETSVKVPSSFYNITNIDIT